MARSYSRDKKGQFGSGTSTSLKDKGKKARTLKAQKDTLKGTSAKKNRPASNKARKSAGDKVTNKQQKREYDKSRRRANGGK